MKTVSRREFIGASAMGLLALKAKAIRPFAAAFDAPLTYQYWILRELLAEDLDGTLKRTRAIGYDGIELCSPIGYGRFLKFATADPVELKRRIEDAGLISRSSHFVSDELLGDNVPATIEYAQKLGLHGLYISSAPFEEREGSLDQWKQFAEQANASGELVKSAGMQLGFHNHNIGPVLNGKPALDHFMEHLDPDLVKIQFQVATASEGYDVVGYLEKYAGHYAALHMADVNPQQRGSVPVGSGSIDWPRLIRAARKSNIEPYGYIVEVGTDEPFEGVTRSHAFLSQLTV